MKRDYDYIVIWIWLDRPCFYSLPIYGQAGVRLAQAVTGLEAIVETRPLGPDPIARQSGEDFLKRYLPTALGPTIYTINYSHTRPPDRGYVIDARHPWLRKLLSGHRSGTHLEICLAHWNNSQQASYCRSDTQQYCTSQNQPAWLADGNSAKRIMVQVVRP